MDADKFFKYPSGNIRVFNFILCEEDIGKRMWRLLNVVVERLPDLPEEEQFRFLGAFMFSTRDNLGRIWEEFDKRVPQAWKGKISSSKFVPDMRQVKEEDRHSIIDGYCTYDFDLSTLENKKGMTRDEIQRLPDEEQWRPFYVVSILTDNLPEKSDDYITGQIAYGISQMSYAWRDEKVMNGLLDSLETQGYEDSVVGEARRLGFEKEMDKFK